jgi:Zn-dependent protease
MSVVIHEVSHGYAASIQGDQTARYAGRLTLNPIKHLDLFGSVIFPIVTSFLGFTFGWAKPVPVNPYNLRNRRWGELLVSMAGPLSNIAVALVFGVLVRAGAVYGFSPSFISISASIVFINLVLAVFNLMPVPPLDGSKVLFSFLPLHLQHIREFLERNALVLMLIFIFFVWRFLFPIVLWLYILLVGPPLS